MIHESIVPTTHVLFSKAFAITATLSMSHLIFRAEKYGKIGNPIVKSKKLKLAKNTIQMTT